MAIKYNLTHCFSLKAINSDKKRQFLTSSHKITNKKIHERMRVKLFANLKQNVEAIISDCSSKIRFY